eukprot:3020004-Lingulodinium_polyedra.AAC.1
MLLAGTARGRVVPAEDEVRVDPDAAAKGAFLGTSANNDEAVGFEKALLTLGLLANDNGDSQ